MLTPERRAEIERRVELNCSACRGTMENLQPCGACEKTDTKALLAALTTAERERDEALECVEAACEFILATPGSFGPVWKERRNAILDRASALGMWKWPKPGPALADQGEA